jgi:lipopolysaccharide transport system ATP-binding protein
LTTDQGQRAESLSKPIIEVENLSKCYQIGANKEPYLSLRDEIAKFASRLRTKDKRQSSQDFWALKDVSFSVQEGEVVGIIGRNGAGKSTLLKILSQITPPTEGKITIRGRVASLLEVGTGFHPELTGRENIYLNGAILGMGRAEIKRKFDEIVDFAEVERFLDTPVKRYSSGMYVRLAFAVAAHLEPEILIVDEVLAVGDVQFQKKCLGKMKDVGKEGRTVLFVSHQMGSIAQLCSTSFLLHKGSIIKAGQVKETVDYYMSNLSSTDNKIVEVKSSDKDMYISKIQSFNTRYKHVLNYSYNEKVIITVTCKINKWLPESVMGFFVTDHKGRKVFTNMNNKWKFVDNKTREIISTVTIPENFLVPGQYSFTFAITVEHVKLIDIINDAIAVTIIDTGTDFAAYEGHDYGCVFADCVWNIEENYSEKIISHR